MTTSRRQQVFILDEHNDFEATPSPAEEKFNSDFLPLDVFERFFSAVNSIRR
jgi:hypothetical protein